MADESDAPTPEPEPATPATATPEPEPVPPALNARALIASAGYKLSVAPSVVLVYDGSLMPSRAATREQRRATHPFRAIGRLADNIDLVVVPGPGAPVAAVTVDFLAAFGVRRLITVGTAGLLTNRGLEGPQVVRTHVVSRAESDEGTSRHYSNHLHADQQLTNALLDRVAGPAAVTLTTDAPFRHTPDKLASHQGRADVIEMECAAVFAAAHFADMAAGALVVLSDTFDKPHRWTQLPSEQVHAQLAAAVSTATNVLAADDQSPTQT